MTRIGIPSLNETTDPMNIILLTMLNRYMVENEVEHVIVTREEFMAVQNRLGSQRHLLIDMTDDDTIDVSFVTASAIERARADSDASILEMLLGLEDRLTPRQGRGVAQDSTTDPSAPQRGADVAGEPSAPQS